MLHSNICQYIREITMANTVYVTKEHYDKTIQKIAKMQADLSLLRQNKKEAYDNCGDGWHDNPFYMQLMHEERMSERRIAETVMALADYTIFNDNIISQDPNIVSLGTRIKIS